MELIVVGMLMAYASLMVIPFIFKRFGLDFIADPLIRVINALLLLPFKAIAWGAKALYRAVAERKNRTARGTRPNA